MKAKKLLGEYVLIEPIQNNKTSSGIVLSKTTEPGDFMEGIVKVVGTGRYVPGVGHVPVDPDLTVGAKVIFQYGQSIRVDEGAFLLVSESDVKIVGE